MIHFDSALAAEYADRALIAAHQPDLMPVIVEALITKGCALGQMGHRYREAQAVLAGAMWLAQRQALVLSEIRARVNHRVSKRRLVSASFAEKDFRLVRHTRRARALRAPVKRDDN